MYKNREINIDIIFIFRITGHCTGTRVIRRTVHKYSPVLILRVVEHCEYKRITLNQILDQLEIHVNGKTYTLAGCTLHRSNHFCAIVSTASRGNLWYDGLEGRLLPIVKDFHFKNILYLLQNLHFLLRYIISFTKLAFPVEC